MNARKVARCLACRGSGETVEQGHTFDCWECSGIGELDCCATCGDAITGSIWQGGNCLACHEGALLPETALDRWENAYSD